MAIGQPCGGTGMTAPTEAEIRAAIADRMRKYPNDNPRQKLAGAVDQAFDAVGYIDLDEEGQYDWGTQALSDLWADLRPSEVERLHELIAEAKRRALDAAWAVIAEQVVAAGLAFAAEYPDAPRAKQEAAC